MTYPTCRYVERLASSLYHLLECVQKCEESIKYAAHKREDLNESIGQTYPKLESARVRAKELKVQVEKALSKQYGGRPVNIIGEINNL